jgi:hypothetical protein
MGLAADGYPSDPVTDAWARYVKNTQSPDGRWTCTALRPPIESSDFQVTAASIKSLKAFGPKSRRLEYDRAVEQAVHWLEAAQARSTEDLAFQILGLIRGGENPAKIPGLTRALAALQRSDGGWSQTRTLASDAYPTFTRYGHSLLTRLSKLAGRRLKLTYHTQIVDWPGRSYGGVSERYGNSGKYRPVRAGPLSRARAGRLPLFGGVKCLILHIGSLHRKTVRTQGGWNEVDHNCILNGDRRLPQTAKSHLPVTDAEKIADALRAGPIGWPDAAN